MKNDELAHSRGLFHARVFRSYIAYLKDELQWGDDRIESLLSKLGTSIERLSHESTWFSLDFADRFFQILTEQTGDEEIAYKAGRSSFKAFGPSVKFLLKNLLKTELIYRLISRLNRHFTRANELRVVEAKRGAVKIECAPLPGMPERDYMTQNRRGILEAAPRVLGKPPARVEILETSSSRILYQVFFKESSIAKQNLGWGVLILLTASLLFFTLPLFFALPIIGIMAVGLIAFHLIRQKNQLKSHLYEQNEFLSQTIKETERKYEELQFISRVTKLTHANRSVEEISHVIVEEVCKSLHYDRSMLLLVDFNRNLLRVRSSFGFGDDLQELIDGAEFNIDPSNETGWFVKVVNTGDPVLIQDTLQGREHLSARSRHFVKMLQSKSFVAVPLKDKEGVTLGVLAADYSESQKQVSIADQDLLMTLSDHLGIAIQNADLLKSLEQQIEETTKVSERQKNLKEVFQKFLPTQVAQQFIHESSESAEDRVLDRVRKQRVSILFLDIFNFSSMTKDLPSESVIEFLNIVFRSFEPLIQKHHGFVDKFLGDGFLAVFDRYQDSCDQSLKAGLEILGQMPTLNQNLGSQGFSPIEIGIGINYGPVILGNIGSQDRVNFTVIGEAVNLAARLEAHTRQIGANSICVSPAVRFQAKGTYPWQSLGPISLKGYSQKIEAFALLSETSKASEFGRKTPKDSRKIR